MICILEYQIQKVVIALASYFDFRKIILNNLGDLGILLMLNLAFIS